MKTLTVYGASDDLIEADGIPGADEFYWRQSGTNTLILVQDRKPKLYIHCFYGYKNITACWCFAVSPIDEDEPLPDWDIRITRSPIKAYSALLTMTVPDDVSMILHNDTTENDNYFDEPDFDEDFPGEER